VQVPEELRNGKIPLYNYSVSSWDSGNTKKNELRNRLFEKQAKDLALLLEKIPQAPFGKGGETVYDASVRDALQVKAQEYELSIPQDKLDMMLTQIKIDLDLETDIVAEPYSINIYQKGGKFAKHKDTPRGDGMLGTLLVCLPTWFTGGEMSVSLGIHTKKFFCNSGASAAPLPNQVKWCAFFSDIDHEVHTVKEGLRVTAAFLLKRSAGVASASIIPKVIHGQEQADRIQEVLTKGLRDERFLADGGTIGFPCLHLYQNTEVFPGQKNSSMPLTSKQISSLKGRDLFVANAAASAGIDVRLVPFLAHEYSMDGGGDWPLSKFPKKKKCPRRMDDETIMSHFDAEDPVDPTGSADLWILEYRDKSIASTDAGSTEWNADGYFGNEASYIDFYVKAALIIDVPEYSAARGVPVVQPPKTKRKPAAKKPAASTVPPPIVTQSSSSATAINVPANVSPLFSSGGNIQYDLQYAVQGKLAGQKEPLTPQIIQKICMEEAVAMANRLSSDPSSQARAQLPLVRSAQLKNSLAALPTNPRLL